MASQLAPRNTEEIFCSLQPSIPKGHTHRETTAAQNPGPFADPLRSPTSQHSRPQTPARTHIAQADSRSTVQSEYIQQGVSARDFAPSTYSPRGSLSSLGPWRSNDSDDSRSPIKGKKRGKRNKRKPSQLKQWVCKDAARNPFGDDEGNYENIDLSSTPIPRSRFANPTPTRPSTSSDVGPTPPPKPKNFSHKNGRQGLYQSAASISTLNRDIQAQQAARHNEVLLEAERVLTSSLRNLSSHPCQQLANGSPTSRRFSASMIVEQGVRSHNRGDLLMSFPFCAGLLLGGTGTVSSIACVAVIANVSGKGDSASLGMGTLLWLTLSIAGVVVGGAVVFFSWALHKGWSFREDGWTRGQLGTMDRGILRDIDGEAGHVELGIVMRQPQAIFCHRSHLESTWNREDAAAGTVKSTTCMPPMELREHGVRRDTQFWAGYPAPMDHMPSQDTLNVAHGDTRQESTASLVPRNEQTASGNAAPGSSSKSIHRPKKSWPFRVTSPGRAPLAKQHTADNSKHLQDESLAARPYVEVSSNEAAITDEQTVQSSYWTNEHIRPRTQAYTVERSPTGSTFSHPSSSSTKPAAPVLNQALQTASDAISIPRARSRLDSVSHPVTAPNLSPLDSLHASLTNAEQQPHFMRACIIQTNRNASSTHISNLRASLDRPDLPHLTSTTPPTRVASISEIQEDGVLPALPRGFELDRASRRRSKSISEIYTASPLLPKANSDPSLDIHLSRSVEGRRSIDISKSPSPPKVSKTGLTDPNSVMQERALEYFTEVRGRSVGDAVKERIERLKESTKV